MVPSSDWNDYFSIGFPPRFPKKNDNFGISPTASATDWGAEYFQNFLPVYNLWVFLLWKGYFPLKFQPSLKYHIVFSLCRPFQGHYLVNHFIIGGGLEFGTILFVDELRYMYRYPEIGFFIDPLNSNAYLRIFLIFWRGSCANIFSWGWGYFWQPLPQGD